MLGISTVSLGVFTLGLFGPNAAIVLGTNILKSILFNYKIAYCEFNSTARSRAVLKLSLFNIIAKSTSYSPLA